MTAPQHEDLEHRLAELFQQRAATVTRARAVDFGSGSGSGSSSGDGTRTPPAGSKQVRLGTHRQNLGVLAAAAAVFVAIAATVLGIQGNQHQPAPPLSTGSQPVSTPTASPTGTLWEKACPAPTSWRQAITGGAFPVDRSLNAVVSVNGATGDYLAVQGNQPPSQSSQTYSDLELALFHGRTGENIFTSKRGTDLIQADPTGAVSPDWVAFAVAHPQGLDYSYQVLLYQRGAGTLRTLAEIPDNQYSQGKAVHGPPVIAAGKVYWLTTVRTRPETTTLDSWDLARGSATGSTPAANATGLVSYGSGVALIRTVADRATLSNAAGAPLPKAQLDAMAGGTNFGFDGAGKLSWLWHDNGLVGYENVVVGRVGTNSEGLVWQSPGTLPAIFPFVDVTLDDADPEAGHNALGDLRTNRAVALPAGVELQALVGDSVVFGTGASKEGAAGLSIVALGALPPVTCERP
jgi:hypothetical protein